MMIDTPVVFIVFNRPETTRVVFSAIAKARPSRLLVVADGARADRPDEAERCRQVRSIVEQVDWPCQVETNFSEFNLGCRARVISGLDWAFSLVEEAIILEDDCVPDPSFFPFCQELLGRFRGDSRVAMISGNNFVERHTSGEATYYFSRMAHIWGWATWRSAWSKLDQNLEHWPEIKAGNLLQEIFENRRVTAHWAAIFDREHEGKDRNVWSYRWAYTTLINNALSVVPRVNLVENIGFGPGATHTTVVDPHQALPARSIAFPLQHPIAIVPSLYLDRRDQKLSLPASFTSRALRRLRTVVLGKTRVAPNLSSKVQYN